MHDLSITNVSLLLIFHVKNKTRKQKQDISITLEINTHKRKQGSTLKYIINWVLLSCKWRKFRPDSIYCTPVMEI